MTVIESIETIMRRTIPSEDTLEMLECAVGQQSLDGARSIADPRFNPGKDRVPLWVLGLWRKLSTTCKYQENWRDAYTMVEQVVKDPIVIVKFLTAEHVFGQQKWNNNVKVGKFTFPTHTFSTLLRPVMIGDDVTQSMIQVAATRKKKLEEAYLPASLRDVDAQIEANPCLKLWFPALQHEHEVVFCIDFGESTITDGDTSRNMPPPKTIIAYLSHGWQEDSISCIPASMNTSLVTSFGSMTGLVHHIGTPHRQREEVVYCDILEAVEAEVEGLDGPEYDAQEISTSKALYEQPTAEPPPVSDDSKKPNKLTSAWASFGFATQTLPGKTSKKRTADFKVNNSESKKWNTGKMSSGSQAGTSKSNQSTKTSREKVKAGIYDPVK
ncbi:hypothetical protein C8J55DRAFT_487167 [Lentinula edodes]|uniref:Uncharacterized protein n=1 Tax=Lentinula lateritia TaxID=40482 RepID=A0A9W9ATP9_9AGAR|nr:hypothetical protein C8J55DRAFT_487167 [Lentinula edodes]